MNLQPIAGIIPGRANPNVADDITINAKIGEYILPDYVVAVIGVDKLNQIVTGIQKQLGLPVGTGPKQHDQLDSLGRRDKSNLKAIAGFADAGEVGPNIYGRETAFSKPIDDIAQAVGSAAQGAFSALPDIKSALNNAYDKTLGNNGTAGSGAPTYTPNLSAKPQPITALPDNFNARRNKFIANEQAQPSTLPNVFQGRSKTPPITALNKTAAVIPAPTAPVPTPSGVIDTKSPGIAVPDMRTAGERIYEYKAPGITDISENTLAAGITGDNTAFDASRKQDMQSGIATPLTPQKIKNYDIGSNGGIATMDGKTFVLPSRGAKEEQQYQTQLTQDRAPQPIAGIAAPTPRTSTVGYGDGIDTFSEGGALLNSTRTGFGAVKRAGIANVYSEINSRNNSDALKVAENPYTIAGKISDIGHRTAETNKLNIMTPLEAAGKQATTANTISETVRRRTLLPGEVLQQGEDLNATRAKSNHFNSLADFEKYKATPEGQRAMKASENKPDSPVAIYKAAHEHAYEAVKDMSIPEEQKSALTESMFWQNVKRYAALVKAMQGGQPAR